LPGITGQGPGEWVALISLAIAMVVALAVYGMPIDQTALSASEGATFGLFPIMWIVVAAVWVYNMNVETGLGVLTRGVSPTLLPAANSSGGVLGKMISPQNLAVGAAAVGLAGREGDLFRKVLTWSIVLVLVMCGLVYLQSMGVLDWMVVK
jgi:L-lactate permease